MVYLSPRAARRKTAFFNAQNEAELNLNLSLLFFLIWLIIHNYFKAKPEQRREAELVSESDKKTTQVMDKKIRSVSWKFYAELLSPTLTISRCCISGKSDLYHCLLPIAGAPPQLVKTACLSLHTSDRITALGVLVC